MNIRTTTDYSTFRRLRGNRVQNPTHVKKLAKSMAEKNLMEYQPVIVNDDMYIIDGQHRVEAARELEMPVHYVVVPDLKIDDIQRLNTYMRSWGIRDYVESYASRGNRDYIALIDFCDEFNLPVTVSAALLSGVSVSEGGVKSSEIKQGKFKVSQEKRARELATLINKVKPFCDKQVWRQRNFIRAIIHVYDKINVDRLIKQMGRVKTRLVKQASMNDYIMALDAIYNYRVSNKQSIV